MVQEPDAHGTLFLDARFCSSRGKATMASIIAVLLTVAAVQASPSISARQSITPLTTSQIDQFTPYTYYASAGYCTNTQTLAWDCGSECPHTPT